MTETPISYVDKSKRIKKYEPQITHEIYEVTESPAINTDKSKKIKKYET